MDLSLKAQSLNLKARAGFYIVESMVALGLLVFGFLGFVALLSSSLSLNRVASHAYIGNFLALEGIELVKNVVDANIIYRQNWGEACEWNSGFSKKGQYDVSSEQVFPESGTCPGEQFVNNHEFADSPLLIDSRGMYNHALGEATPFRRRIVVSPVPENEPDSDELKVNSIVTWTTRGGGKFEVSAEDHLFNWQRR